MRTRLRERVGAGAECDHRETRADEVEAARRVRVASLGHRDARTHDDDQRDRHVDEERPSPTRSVDEPAAEERTDRARDTAEARPRADGGRAIGLAEAHLDDREAPGREQRGTDTLQDARGHEDLDVRRRAAQQRRGREPDRADEEHLAPAETVTERASEEDQRRERE